MPTNFSMPMLGSICLLPLLLSACEPSEHRHADPIPAMQQASPILGGAVDAASSDIVAAERLFVCPMHPQIQQGMPGTCPICGMRLVERTPPAAIVRAEPQTFIEIDIDAGRLQRLGVRLQPVQRGQLRSGLRVPAQVLALPAQRHALEVRTSGWVQRLVVSTEGQSVRAGELLAELYLPEVETLRVELGLAPELAAGAAERLRRLGVAERDITALRDGQLRQRLPLRAPANGVVSELAAVEGQRVEPGSRLFLIEGRQQWLQARVPLSRAHALAEGVHSARLRLPGDAGWRWLDGDWQRAELVDSITQTQAWRLALDALTQGLPIGSYAEVELFGRPRPAQLLVPRSAVLRHVDEARVVRRDAQGRLSLQRVRLGAAEGGQVEVLEGLAPGDSVVVRAQFLIEAEAELDGVLQRWAGTPPTSAHDHGSHDHGSHDHDSRDHGSHDHDSRDHGSRDHGSHDHGSHDHDSHDHGSHDHGSRDHDSRDHGNRDHSSHDHGSHRPVSGHQGHRHD